MYITRVLIGRNQDAYILYKRPGRNPCLDQAIQTRKFKVKVF
jgi:hypothetical protein